MYGKKRKISSGFLFVVGGPGASGSSVISSMLAKHFKLEHVNAGEIFREIVRERYGKSIEEFFTDSNKDVLSDIDREVDERLLEIAMRKDVLIESKIFAALASLYDIPCTVKIWLDASLHVRTMRSMKKSCVGSWGELFVRYLPVRHSLYKRRIFDRERYWELYGIDYDLPFVYNDIVIDSSAMDERMTFKLLLKNLKDGGYVK